MHVINCLKRLLKRIAIPVLGSDFVLQRKLSYLASTNALTILNIHRVCNNTRDTYESLQPQLFEELLSWLKTQFRILTFRELAELPVTDKPLLILSFDDGYRDFIDVVVPILDKYNIAVNQNIIPNCVETGLPPVNVIVRDFVGSAPEALLREISFPGLPEGVDFADREWSGLLASAAIKTQPITEQKKIYAELAPQFARFDGFHTTPLMNLEEIRQAATVHEIGVHSFEHANMTAESNDYFTADIARCREWFTNSLNAKPHIYAFPNGAARDEQAKQVRDAGFPIVLLVGESFSRRDAWLHNRFTFCAKSFAEARFRAAGALATPSPEIHVAWYRGTSEFRR